MMRRYRGYCNVMLGWFFIITGSVHGRSLPNIGTRGMMASAAVGPTASGPTQTHNRSTCSRGRPSKNTATTTTKLLGTSYLSLRPLLLYHPCSTVRISCFHDYNLRGPYPRLSVESVMRASSSGSMGRIDKGSNHASAWARRRVALVDRDSEGPGWAGGAGLGAVFSSLSRSTRQPWERWKSRHWGLFADKDVNRREQAAARAAGARPEYKLTFWGCMVAGAVSRSVAQTALHPANVIKTLLQAKGSVGAILPLTWTTLARGAGAQFLLSLPNGALHFAVLENTKMRMTELFPVRSASFLLDFASSSTATALCSVMSTPQMVLTNRIMAGVYPNLLNGVRRLVKEEGLRGFYVGWWPGLVQKVPSYALTWVLFQQVKDLHYKMAKRLPTNTENFWLGCIAAAGSVTIMIPMDTVKTRLVTQSTSPQAYTGILNCFSRMLREEGIRSFYNSLTPRLVSVVPMIGVQYLVYEFIKKVMAEVPESVLRSPEDMVMREKLDELDSVTDP